MAPDIEMRSCRPATYWSTADSPLGELLLVARDDSLTQVGFAPFEPPEAERADNLEVLAAAGDQLVQYFTGDREVFDLPLAPPGTDFRQAVWAELRKIPYGTTTTYGAIARSLGLTGHGARAVGHANGSNPIALVVPCHRVVGSDGSLTGYGGGIERKRALLALERTALF